MSLAILRPMTPRQQAEAIVDEALTERLGDFIGMPTNDQDVSRIRMVIESTLKDLVARNEIPAGIGLTEVVLEPDGQLRVRIDYPDWMGEP